MNLDEEAINAVREYFESIAQSAVDVVHESVGSDTTFAEFMEAINLKINLFSSELVASEVLKMSAGSIESFNGGEGVDVNDVQEMIDSGGTNIDEDDDDA